MTASFQTIYTAEEVKDWSWRNNTCDCPDCHDALKLRDTALELWAMVERLEKALAHCREKR